jgi:hypothetical protein
MVFGTVATRRKNKFSGEGHLKKLSKMEWQSCMRLQKEGILFFTRNKPHPVP